MIALNRYRFSALGSLFAELSEIHIPKSFFSEEDCLNPQELKYRCDYIFLYEKRNNFAMLATITISKSIKQYLDHKYQ